MSRLACSSGGAVALREQFVVLYDAHGCRVGDGALVGIAAVVLDGAEIGEEALVGAGALVPPGARIPARHLALGVPARVVRPLRDEEVRSQRARAREYVETARGYAQDRR